MFMRMLIGAATVVAVVLAWSLGHKLGVEQERSVQDQVLIAERDAWLEQRTSLETQVGELQVERDVGKETITALRDAMHKQQRLSTSDANELQLFRRIAGAEGKARINASEDGSVAVLRITLIQSRGRDRVAGSLGVTLVGRRAGASHREVIASADNRQAPSFDMRFFQTVSVPTFLDEEFEIDRVEIAVKPRGVAYKPFQTVLPWGEIRQHQP